MSRPKKVDNNPNSNVQAEQNIANTTERMQIRKSNLQDFVTEIEYYVKKGYKIDLNLHPVIFLRRSSTFVCEMSRENES